MAHLCTYTYFYNPQTGLKIYRLLRKVILYLWNRWKSDTGAFVGIVHEFVQVLHELEE